MPPTLTLEPCLVHSRCAVLNKITVQVWVAPEPCVGAAGQHYAHKLTDKIQMTLRLETDPSTVLNEIIYCTRKVCLLALCSDPTSGGTRAA